MRKMVHGACAVCVFPPKEEGCPSQTPLPPPPPPFRPPLLIHPCLPPFQCIPACIPCTPPCTSACSTRGLSCFVVLHFLVLFVIGTGCNQCRELFGGGLHHFRRDTEEEVQNGRGAVRTEAGPQV